MNAKATYKTIGGGLHHLWLNIKHHDNLAGNYCRLPPPDTTRIVVLVPGWLEAAVTMDGMAQLFEKKGFAVCTVHMGFQSLRSLRSLRRMLQRFLFQLSLHCPNLEEIFFVAHSMGGLICWDAIQTGVVDGKRVRLVTLGTMFNGTPHAIWGCPFSLSAWDLLPIRSRFNPRPHYGRMHYVPFLSIAGKYDLIVPPESCHHPQAENKIIRADHGSLLTKPGPFKLAYAFLTRNSDYHPPVKESFWGPYR